MDEKLQKAKSQAKEQLNRGVGSIIFIELSKHMDAGTPRDKMIELTLAKVVEDFQDSLQGILQIIADLVDKKITASEATSKVMGEPPYIKSYFDKL